MRLKILWQLDLNQIQLLPLWTTFFTR